MSYKLIDHTADLGINVFGADLKDLFASAACAMFDLITDTDRLEGSREHVLKVAGDDWPDLMVNWLREILYLWNGKEMLLKAVKILSLSEYELIANLRFDNFVPDRHLVKIEIKAVTYHQIQVNKIQINSRPGGWEAKIIFDV